MAVSDTRPLFASSVPSNKEPRRRGMSTWLTLAVSMVVGILIGFASGYRAGQGQVSGIPGDEQGAPAAPTSGESGAQPFSESTVDGPVRVEEQPIVPAPEGAASAPAEPGRRGTRPPVTPEPAAVGRVPPTVESARARPAAPPAATGPGSLQVLSRPAGAQVILDGKPVGRTPLTIPDVSAGPHDIRLELPSFNRWATTVDVPAGQPARVAASLEQ